MQYAINAHQKCLLLEPLLASPYLVGLVWYALSYFRMCLYQAFFGHAKKTLKTQGKKLMLNLWIRIDILKTAWVASLCEGN